MPTTFTTELPDAQQPSLSTPSNGDLELSYTDVINNGEYYAEWREVGASAWNAGPTAGEANATLTLTGVEHGEEVEVQLRTQTEHVTGEWTTPVSAITEIPQVTDLLAKTDSPGSASIQIAWTKADNSPDGNVDVHRSDDGGSTWSTVATAIGTASTSYTDTPPSTGQYYDYRIDRYTDHNSQLSNTDDGWSARSFSRSVEINSQTASLGATRSKAMPRSAEINGSGSLEATHVKYGMQRSAEIHGRADFQAGAEFEEVFPSQSSTDLDFDLITTPVLGFASEWVYDEPDMDDTSAFTAVLDARFEGPVDIRIQYDGVGDGVPDYTTDKRVVLRNGQTLSWPEIGDGGWYRIVVSGMRLGDYIRAVTWGPTRY